MRIHIGDNPKVVLISPGGKLHGINGDQTLCGRAARHGVFMPEQAFDYWDVCYYCWRKGLRRNQE